MNASIHRVSGFALLALAFGLSGCQSQSHTHSPAKKQTDADFDALGRMEFEAAMLGHPEANSIVRDGDHVSYFVMSLEGKQIRRFASFNADCHLPDAQMAHLTTQGMMRFAVDRRSDTPAGKQMPAEQKTQYLQGAQLKQVCAQTPVPQWRVISAPDQQDWLLIDRASLNQKNGQLFFWSSRVPAGEALMPSAVALYAQERTRWSANCAQRQLTSLSNFYINKQNRVIAGTLTQDAVALKSLDAERRLLLNTACGSQQSLDLLKPFAGREQTAFVLPDPVLPASVVNAIDALKLPPPEKSIQRLRVKYNSANEAREQKEIEDSGLSILKNDTRRRELGRLGSDTTYLTYEPGKQLTERIAGEHRQAVNLSFRGLIPLAHIDYTNNPYGIRVRKDAISDLRFDGDWTNLPVGAHLSYTVQMSIGSRKPTLIDRRFDCDVKSQNAASEFHLSLTGTAKIMTCTGNDSRRGQTTATYAYLQSYGMFVPVDSRQTNAYGRFTIEKIE